MQCIARIHTHDLAHAQIDTNSCCCVNELALKGAIRAQMHDIHIHAAPGTKPNIQQIIGMSHGAASRTVTLNIVHAQGHELR